MADWLAAVAALLNKLITHDLVSWNEFVLMILLLPIGDRLAAGTKLLNVSHTQTSNGKKITIAKIHETIKFLSFTSNVRKSS